MFDLQKAGIFKRFSAFLVDVVAFFLLAISLALVLSTVLGYDNYNNTIEEARAKYAAEYDINLNITAEEKAALPDDVKARYDAADKAYGSDPEVIRAHVMVEALMLLLVSLCVLIPSVVLEFVVPLLLKNGQTLGKKIFGLAVVRSNSVKATGPAMFIRAIIGKCTMETMVPICILIMIVSGKLGSIGLIVLALIAILQAAMMISTRTNSCIHDLISDTVVVDYASQRIFESNEELLEAKKKAHLEAAQSAKY